MADYNTFNLVDTKTRKTLLTTSSARKCKKEFVKGRRIDVWNGNVLVDVIYNKNIDDINKYVRLEKEHIAQKQKRAEARNKARKARAAERNAVRMNECHGKAAPA